MTALEGIFLSLYLLLVIVIAQDRRDRLHTHKQDFVIWVASVMMVFTTAVSDTRALRRLLTLTGQHLIIDAVRAFIGLTGGTDAHAYFHSVTNTTFLTKTVLWMGQTLLGDGILVRSAMITLKHAVLTGSCTWRSGDATSFTADG